MSTGKWRMTAYWLGRDGWWRTIISDHASEAAAVKVGKQRVADGASHYEVFEKSCKPSLLRPEPLQS